MRRVAHSVHVSMPPERQHIASRVLHLNAMRRTTPMHLDLLTFLFDPGSIKLVFLFFYNPRHPISLATTGQGILIYEQIGGGLRNRKGAWPARRNIGTEVRDLHLVVQSHVRGVPNIVEYTVNTLQNIVAFISCQHGNTGLLWFTVDRMTN